MPKCRAGSEPDEVWKTFEDASAKYFKAGKRPTIAETIAYYRERKIGLVMFTVDSEFEIGARRIPNEEVADAARENSDIMMAFASIDPHKGKMGVREARRLIEGRRASAASSSTRRCRASSPTTAWPIRLYEVIAEHKLPAIFHSGHSGIGTGMPRRRRPAAEVLQPDAPRRRRGGFPGHDRSSSRTRPGRGRTRRCRCACTSRTSTSTCRAGRRSTFRRSSCSTPTRSSRRRMLFGSDYPADHARPLDEGLRRSRLQARSAAADPQGERDGAPRARRLSRALRTSCSCCSASPAPAATRPSARRPCRSPVGRCPSRPSRGRWDRWASPAHGHAR